MIPFLIDTHAHLNFNAFKDDWSEVIKRSLDKDIWMINVGSQFDTSKRAIEIADKYDEGVYTAIGLHPIHLMDTDVDEEEIKFKSREEKFDEKKYQELINNSKKIVAVGEIGLDYFHVENKKLQKQELIKQLEFANKNKLPVILHCRGSKENPLDAYNDLLEILPVGKGVIHCFGANTEIAEKFIKLGFYIGFTGIITFGKNADNIREVVKDISINKILIETDCPYLAPDPHRGARNEPSYVEYIVKKIADIKNIEVEEVARVVTNNAKKLFL